MTESALHIRPAIDGDTAEMTEMIMRSKQSNGYDDAFMAACREELTVTASSLKAREYWIAEAGGIRGCASIAKDEEPNAGEVHAFFIDPDFQRRGVGRKLWSKIVERSRSRGFDALYLDADPAAVPFYEAMGFRIVGESPSGSIPGRVLPRMKTVL